MLQKCLLFIYPSLYEGFGIPILEAMHEGCPTIVSDIPVLEILDNRSYFWSKNCENLIFNMEKILFDSEIKKVIWFPLGERLKNIHGLNVIIKQWNYIIYLNKFLMKILIR